MAIYYHVSSFLVHDGEFTPRIPKNRIKELEEAETPRVCVSTSIEHCLTALPGSSQFTAENYKRRGYYKVFVIDTEKLGISDDKIIDPEFLYQNGWVPDANETKEHWILEPFTVSDEDSMYIKIESWKSDLTEIVPYDVQVVADKHFDGDIRKAYPVCYDGNIPVIHRIYNVKFQTSKVKPGDELNLMIGHEQEEEVLIPLLTKSYKAEIVCRDKGLIRVRFSKNKDLLYLFAKHLVTAYQLPDEDDLDGFWD